MRTVTEMYVAGTTFLSEEAAAKEIGADEELIRKYWPAGPGKLCLDVGSGPGTWSLVSLARGATVYSFDPKPEAVRMLMDNVILNGFTKAFVMPFGLWSSTGLLPFGPNSFIGSTGPKRPVVALDDFVETVVDPDYGNIDLVNIDAEGAEIEIICGASRTLEMFTPRLVIEVHAGVDRDELKREIHRRGIYSEKYAFIDDGGFLIVDLPQRFSETGAK